MSSISRRHLLRTAAAMPAAVLVPRSEAAETKTKAPKAAVAKKPVAPLTLPPVQPGPAYLMAGPMLGHVGPDRAHVWVRGTAAVPWKLVLTKAGAPTREIDGGSLKAEAGLSGIAIIEGLKPSTHYTYQIVLDGREQLPLPLPSFTTAPEIGSACRQRIAFGSCVGRTTAAAAPTWAELAARRAATTDEGAFDLLLMLGDNHYGDTTEIEKLRVYYTAHRLGAGWRDLSARSPVYAIWDDHDYGPNNSDGTEAGKADSLKTFQEFWANPACGEADNPGCYFTFTRGDVQFFMCDGRYHRSPNKAEDAPGKTMLGEKQLAWLKRELLASKAKVKLVANGSEWESYGSEDSWTQFKQERDPFLRWIDEQKLEGVIFLSGDRHFSSGYHINGRFLELSAGPFGSDNSKLRANQERFTGFDDGRLWGVLDIDTTASPPRVAYEFWQTGHSMRERREISWAQLHGREKIERSKGYEI
ncbi:alkaline phosphatase D family protein [Prosthecobacter sp.]|uniref:alkaline phosphatase D family protein n=1 Tax=Prosthecobacter sp. TaxID=1965333 RepID=UPI003783BF7C